MFRFRIRVPGSSPVYSTSNSASAKVHPGKQPVMIQKSGSLPPVLETCIKSLALDFVLTQPWLLKAFGNKSVHKTHPHPPTPGQLGLSKKQGASIWIKQVLVFLKVLFSDCKSEWHFFSSNINIVILIPTITRLMRSTEIHQTLFKFLEVRSNCLDYPETSPGLVVRYQTTKILLAFIAIQHWSSS